MQKRLRKKATPNEQVAQGFIGGLLLNLPWFAVAVGVYFQGGGDPMQSIMNGLGFCVVLSVNLLAALFLKYKGMVGYSWRGFLLAFIVSVLLIPSICAAGG